ncbi:MAG: glycosyltransferase [Thermoanaerobaculia bacterium]|nr:glycosyltransferase [Thermoanaerobaculia bacterium]
MRVPPALLRTASVRRGLRSARKTLSIGWYRTRALLGFDLGPRVVVDRAAGGRRIPHPAILVTREGANPDRLQVDSHSSLDHQTETSVTTEATNTTAPYWLRDGGDLGTYPATHLESLLMALAAEDLPYAVSGWSSLPTEIDRFVLRVPSGPEASSATLVATQPSADSTEIIARRVPHLTATSLPSAAGEPGPYQLRPWLGAGLQRESQSRLVLSPVQPVHEVLAALPAMPGPPTVLFVLPYLAVGGAERLLLQLLAGLGSSCRSLVVTLEPHLADRGQTLDEARLLTDHVYTLGDWLPREARMSALRHLIRRYEVQTLFGWNGATDFYDRLTEIRCAWPQLRILNQLFNHQGGWMEHYSQAVIDAVDLHVAINGPIRRALVERWQLPGSDVVQIDHAVSVPEPPADAEREARRHAIRGRLGIPLDPVVVGTFGRLHPQKRPLDVVATARRLADRPVHFLLVGGGPLDGAVDTELRRHPLTHLTRLPLHQDVSELFDAIDLCLMTSEYEGLPLFLLEGLARGIPCVAPAVGDIPHLLEEGGGRTVRVGDIEAFATAILELSDPETRRAEGEAGRRRIERDYSLGRYVEQYREAIFPRAENA